MCARIARVVIENVAHHITQRGVRSQNIFWNDDDRNYYLNELKIQSEKYNLKILGYCLMSNHVHFIVSPEFKDSIARTIGETHRIYTRRINFRDGVRGHLFQERFFSCPLDERHKVSAMRYIERNPVRAGIEKQAWNYIWSSAKLHTGKIEKDFLIGLNNWHYTEKEWMDLLKKEPDEKEILKISSKTGRPCGDIKFFKECERITSRNLLQQKAGRKKKSQ
ncbi:MAG: hypothetical protein ACD_79C00901G0002 [uncultured bacterium]|nr:MAG: hypothetical protein ACD_79C00901G0002 [uncultured bacterium]